LFRNHCSGKVYRYDTWFEDDDFQTGIAGKAFDLKDDLMCFRMEPRPEKVIWKDLEAIPKYQFLLEITLPLPWLLISIAAYSSSFWYLGPLFSFFFFLCCLRLNHEAIHSNLRLSRFWDHFIMHGLSALMIGSNHADAFCHLLHHKDTMGENDHEAKCASYPAWKVLLTGPFFPIELNKATWRLGGPKWRYRVAIDWGCVAIFIFIGLGAGINALILHVLFMLVGQCLTAFFAVWITHRGTHETGLAGRSQRGRFSWIAYQMFFHREHHLYPTVPVSRLRELAERLDDAVPDYAEKNKAVVSLR